MLANLAGKQIAAYSPQARGRSERAFRILQKRLPKELALAGMVTAASANAFLQDSYVTVDSDQFAVAAEQAGTAFTALPAAELAEVLCRHQEHQVGAGQHGRAGVGAAAGLAQPAAGALRAGDGEGAARCGRQPRGVPRPALHRAL